MASLGQELKRERELRGISLKEISDSTKISIRFLEALEEDRFDIMPGKFFIRAALRSYAKFIGLEEHSVLNKYYEGFLLQEKAQEAEEQKRKELLEIPKKRKRMIVSVIVFAFLLGLLSLLYIFFPKTATSPYPEEQNAPIFLQEEKPVQPPPTESETPAEPLPEQKELSLEISFLELTWIQVYADGELKLEGNKEPGERAAVKAGQELLIHLGNAGGIAYTLNNKQGRKFGRSGAVVKNIRINVENYQEFLEQEKESKDER